MLSFLQFITETSSIKYQTPKKEKKTGDPLTDRQNELRHIEKLRTTQLKKISANIHDNGKRNEKRKEIELKSKLLKKQKGLI